MAKNELKPTQVRTVDHKGMTYVCIFDLVKVLRNNMVKLLTLTHKLPRRQLHALIVRSIEKLDDNASVVMEESVEENGEDGVDSCVICDSPKPLESEGAE